VRPHVIGCPGRSAALPEQCRSQFTDPRGWIPRHAHPGPQRGALPGYRPASVHAFRTAKQAADNAIATRASSYDAAVATAQYASYDAAVAAAQYASRAGADPAPGSASNAGPARSALQSANAGLAQSARLAAAGQAVSAERSATLAFPSARMAATALAATAVASTVMATAVLSAAVLAATALALGLLLLEPALAVVLYRRGWGRNAGVRG